MNNDDYIAIFSNKLSIYSYKTRSIYILTHLILTFREKFHIGELLETI